jgi:hypothetical protein
MPNPATYNNHMHTPRVRNGEPQPTALQTPEPASAKRDLTSWWRQFSKKPAKKDDEKGTTSATVYGDGAHVRGAALSALQLYLLRLRPRQRRLQ